MRYVAAMGFVGVLVALVACGPSRPPPDAPVDDWRSWCESRDESCQLCAGEGNCGYCPATRQCLYFNESDQSAGESCPAIIKNAPMCGQ
jgi:hypothetical protein